MHSSLQLILPYLDTAGISYTLEAYGWLLLIDRPDGTTYPIHGSDFGFNTSSTARLLRDKQYTLRALEQHAIHTPQSYLITPPEHPFGTPATLWKEIENYADTLTFPLIAKPNGSSLGRNVSYIENKQSLTHWFTSFHAQHEYYVLQEYIPGIDYRVLYLDGEILASYSRTPPTVTGDGASTLGHLIATYIESTVTQKIHESTAQIREHIYKQGFTVGSIIERGQSISLLPTANISTGGTAQLVELSLDDETYIHRIADALGITYGGIDIISAGPITDGTVIEVNNAPWIDGICEIDETFREIFGKVIRKKIASLL